MATILIVDDHVLNREFLLTLLGYGGHCVLEAADGVTALNLVREKCPDLIIADILMPNMSGHEFAMRLRADPALSSIPLIFFTATFREFEAKAMANACGVRWVLPKPSEPALILQTVQEALKTTATAPEATASLLSPPESRVRANDYMVGYLDEIETSNELLSEIVQDTDPSKRQERELLASRLSKSLSCLQAVGLRLSTLIDLGIELASERDSTRLMEAACRTVHSICDASYTVVAMFPEGGERACQFVALGLDDNSRARLETLARNEGLLNLLQHNRAPQRRHNPSGIPADLGLPAWHPPVHSFLGVNICSPERVYGVLYLVDKRGAQEFSELDERSATAVAAQLAVAHENLDVFQKFRQQHDELLREMDERKKYQSRIEYLANHDPLTDLPNRNLLSDRITQAMLQSRRLGTLLALLFLDLDRFKEINDSLGHGQGDAVLKATAERLRGAVRAGDTVARHGGDEFIILLTNLNDLQHLEQIADKIVNVLSQPFFIDKHPVHVSASIGVTVYPNDSEDLHTLLQNADTAMYRAKLDRSHSFRFYSRDMSTHAQERAAMEHALRLAIERREFELFYQPKVSLRDGQIYGAEALIRWQNPQKGMISPTSFIPLAEETGLIVPIGEWVSRTACLQNSAWQQAGLPAISIAINLSARQFKHPKLVESLADSLRQAGLESKYLELELTESLVMNNAELFIVKLRELKALGMRLSIDDFGTGYSSLSYLKRFPIDSIKIDQSFIRDIVTDTDDAAITRSVISLGHSLHLDVIAEGVETEEQRDYLQHHDCDLMQGFYFSEPLSASEFERVLRQQ